MKTSGNIESTRQLGKNKVKVDDNGRTERDNKCKLGSEVNNGEINQSKIRDNKVGKKDQKMSKSKNLFKFKKLSKSKKTLESNFFTLGARLAFTKLRQTFVKAPILYYFDLERYIRIEMDISGYAIDGVLS